MFQSPTSFRVYQFMHGLGSLRAAPVPATGYDERRSTIIGLEIDSRPFSRARSAPRRLEALGSETTQISDDREAASREARRRNRACLRQILQNSRVMKGNQAAENTGFPFAKDTAFVISRRPKY
jgi:hypothetical protein